MGPDDSPFTGPAALSDRGLVRIVESRGAVGADLEEIVSACPRALTTRWQEDHKVSGAALAALRSYRSSIDAKEKPWPWGLGPIEQVFDGLDRAFGLEAACRMTESSLMRLSLSKPYIEAASAQISATLQGGDIRRAERMNRILLVAIEGDSVEDRAGCCSIVWLTWLEVARRVIGYVPDQDVFKTASRVKDSLLDLADTTQDRALACDARAGFAMVVIAPYASGGVEQADVRIKRWAMRGLEYGFPMLEPRVIPLARDALSQGEALLRHALDDAMAISLPWIGRIRASLAEILLRRGMWQDTDSGVRDVLLAEAGDLAEQAVTDLPDADLPLRLNAYLILVEVGRDFDVADLESLCRLPLDDYIARYGSHETGRLVLMVAQILGAKKPDAALYFLASTLHYQRNLPRTLRELLLPVHMMALFAAPIPERVDQVVSALRQEAGGQELIEALAPAAAAGGWTPSETLRVAIMAAGARAVNAKHILPVMDWARALAPEFAEQHSDAIAYVAAGTAADLATAAYTITMDDGDPEERGEPASATEFLAEALRRYCELRLTEGALECIEILQNLVLFGRPGIAGLVIQALQDRVASLEALCGEHAFGLVAELLNICISKLVDENDLEWIVDGLLLAKGHAFSISQASGATFDPLTDPVTGELLARIYNQEQALDPGAVSDDGFDELRLLTPYLAAHDESPTAGPVQILRGLQHSLDEHIERQLMTTALGSARAGAARRWSANGLHAAIPEHTVVIIFYVADGPPSCLMCGLLTHERGVVTIQPLTAEDAATGPDGHMLSFMQGATAYMRRAVQEDPGPRVVDRDAGQALEEWESGLLGPAVDVLAGLRAKGYRHLAVVPHGAWHFFPIHLFGPPGKPLCADWLVTLLPAPLSLVAADEQPRRRRHVRAVALGIDFHDYPGPGQFEPLTNVLDEVRSVAEAVGGVALVNAEVTKLALVRALEDARWVHLATHGTSNAYAPCFDALAVWPEAEMDGRLAAYEILAIDLHGLELVTLSACDTALGRFDVADNLRGLTSTLLKAGARTVIGTLWPVETTTSTKFFKTLYACLNKDTATGEAFHEAQRVTRRSHPQYRDWGAFVLVGSWAG